MAESKNFSAEAGSAKVVGTVSSADIAEPIAPPMGLRAMGPRITFHFVGEWDAETSYVLYDVVRVNGTSYIGNKINIAKGINPETDNNVHWVKWNDPNAQVELLQQTVNGFDARITEAEADVTAAVADAAAAKKASADNATAISAEATRANAAEEANAAAIQAEATRAKAAEAAISSKVGTPKTMRAKVFHKAVTFGDSWERGFWGLEEHQGSGWLTNAAKVLGVHVETPFVADGAGYRTGDVLNMSVDGTGFDTGQTFLTRLKQVTDDQWKDVDLILIGGGVNDTDPNASRNNAVFMVQHLCENVLPKCSPQCEVHFFAGNVRTPATLDNLEVNAAINRSLVRATGYQGSMLKGQSICVHSGLPDFVNVFPRDTTDSVHLTEQGYQMCGAWCANEIMTGGSSTCNWYTEISNINSDVTATENEIYVRDGVLLINCVFKAQTTISVGTTIAALGAGLHPTHAIALDGIEINSTGGFVVQKQFERGSQIIVRLSYPFNMVS